MDNPQGGSKAHNEAGSTHQPQHAVPMPELHHDILMQIFEINATMNEDHPLKDKKDTTRNIPRAIDTTRISSQVSFLWRDLIVNSPRLWASLIDLDVLDVSKENWRKEVLRRTQSSPLHVKGSLVFRPVDTPDKPWWFDFFNDNWTRIRIFEVTLFSNNVIRPRRFELIRAGLEETAQFAKYKKALAFLSRSATNLESFCLKLPFPIKLLEAESSLFKNHAPRLRSFQVHCWPVQLTKQCTWFSQLDNLHILESVGKTFASVDEVYKALSQIPRLKSLYLTDAIASLDIASHRAPLNLPLLERVEMRSRNFVLAPHCRPSHFWKVLKMIVPKPGCSIRVLTSLIQTDADIDVEVLSRYVENYTNVNNTTRLTFSSGRYWFKLTDVPQTSSSESASSSSSTRHWQPDDVPFFEFNLGFTFPVAAEEKLHRLLETTFSLSFSTVTNLTLDVNLSDSHPSTSESTMSQFQDFLTSFSRVSELTTNHAILHSLIISPIITISTLFPRLRVLKMAKLNAGTEPKSLPTFTSILTSFLDLRKKAGRAAVCVRYENIDDLF